MRKSLKISVVDDEASILQTVQQYLEDLGHRVIKAPDPVTIYEAWHLMTAARIKLAVMH